MNEQEERPTGGSQIIDGYGDGNSLDRLQELYNHLPADAHKEIGSKFTSDMWEIFDRAGSLLLTKHRAYGPRNISQAPGGPENGLRVRMWDKMARLNHILENPGVDTNDESLEDTLTDLLNYCAIFLMVRRGQWPK
jgi:hypothetical protein